MVPFEMKGEVERGEANSCYSQNLVHLHTPLFTHQIQNISNISAHCYHEVH